MANAEKFAKLGEVLDDPGFFQQHILHVKGLGEDSLDNLQYDFEKIVQRFREVRGYLREAIDWELHVDSFTIEEGFLSSNTALLQFNMIHNLIDGGPDLQELISKLQRDYSGRLTTHSPAKVIELVENGTRLYFAEAGRS